MNRRHLLLNGAAGFSAAILGGCFHAPVDRSISLAPFPGRDLAFKKILDKFRDRDLRFGAPAHLVAYKQERQMEVWVEGRSGRYEHFATYEICNFSGGIGPKLREGDRQTPEGFYEIRPNMMNPWSSYHLGINLGFPNHYDRAHGRTGSLIAIHGGCDSIGCFAMGDAFVTEIYLILEQSFAQGADRATLASYPFRPTQRNLEGITGHKWEGFWRNIFESHSHFKSLGRPPFYSVRRGKYRFTAHKQGTNSTRGYPRG